MAREFYEVADQLSQQLNYDAQIMDALGDVHSSEERWYQHSNILQKLLRKTCLKSPVATFIILYG